MFIGIKSTVYDLVNLSTTLPSTPESMTDKVTLRKKTPLGSKYNKAEYIKIKKAENVDRVTILNKVDVFDKKPKKTP